MKNRPALIEADSPGQPGRRALRPLLVCMTLAASSYANASPSADLIALNLEQLLDVAVVGASKYEQKQSEVAAAVSVITRSEIKAFG